MPRVNGSSPGAPSRAAGSKPASASGPYTTSTGMPDSVRRSSMPISLPSGGRAEAGQEGAQLLAGAGPVGGGGLEQDRVAAAARQEGEVVAVPRPPVQHHGELPFGGGAVLEGGRPQADALVVASRVPGHEGALQAALGGQRRQAVAGRLDAEEAAASSRASASRSGRRGRGRAAAGPSAPAVGTGTGGSGRPRRRPAPPAAGR